MRRFVVFGLLGIVMGLMTGNASGQYYFNRSAFLTGRAPSAAMFADFNGDRIPDLAVTNYSDNTVSILLGQPNGTFANKVDYATGVQPGALVAADFNGDGKVDLAVLNESAQTVSILLGNGNGTFQSHVDYHVGISPLGIVAASFTASGYMDLAVANWNDSTVSILLNNGNGTFQTQTLVSVAPNPQSIASGDFNADGKVDLITASADPGIVSVLLSNGNGTFTRVDSPSGVLGPDFTSVISGDFTPAAHLDAVVSSRNSSQLFLLLGDGNGGFQQPVPLLPPLGFYAPITTMIAADLNQDGKLDLAANGDALFVLFGNGGGSFRPPIIVPTAGEIDAFAQAIDVNQDGNIDITAVDGTINAVKILLGRGAIPSYTDLPYDTLAPDGTVVADFNGDGKPDIAVAQANFPTGKLAVELGKGNGTFEKPITSPMGGEGINNNELMIPADFNADGRPDLLVLDDYTTGFYISLGNGDGTFQPAVNTPLSYRVDDLATADFNGDGKADVAVTADVIGGGTLNIFLSNGDGTFRTGAQYSVGFYSYVAAADMNNDGKVDLILASFGSPLTLFLGNGDGTFQPPIQGPSATYNSNLVLRDFNNDGRVDVAVGTYGGIAFLAGIGDGTFSGPVYSDSTLLFCCQLTAGDFNGDGKLDLVTNGAINNREADVMIGNGAGTFGPLIPYGPPGQLFTRNLVAGDFNADGIDDLAMATSVTSPAADTISLYLSSPTVSLSGLEVNFGTVKVGKTSAPQSVELSNIGNSNLIFSRVILTGDFIEQNDCKKGKQIGASCTIELTFVPKTKGKLRGSLKIYDNASSSPQTVQLVGSGD